MNQEAVRALQREKRDAQRHFVATRRAILQDQKKAGTIDALTLNRATMEVLKVEMELAETPAEKRAVLEKMLREARLTEDILRAEREMGVSSDSVSSNLLQANIERLNIQIQLEETK